MSRKRETVPLRRGKVTKGSDAPPRISRQSTDPVPGGQLANRRCPTGSTVGGQTMPRRTVPAGINPYAGRRGSSPLHLHVAGRRTVRTQKPVRRGWLKHLKLKKPASVGRRKQRPFIRSVPVLLSVLVLSLVPAMRAASSTEDQIRKQREEIQQIKEQIEHHGDNPLGEKTNVSERFCPVWVIHKEFKLGDIREYALDIAQSSMVKLAIQTNHKGDDVVDVYYLQGNANDNFDTLIRMDSTVQKENTSELKTPDGFSSTDLKSFNRNHEEAVGCVEFVDDPKAYPGREYWHKKLRVTRNNHHKEYLIECELELDDLVYVIDKPTGTINVAVKNKCGLYKGYNLVGDTKNNMDVLESLVLTEKGKNIRQIPDLAAFNKEFYIGGYAKFFGGHLDEFYEDFAENLPKEIPIYAEYLPTNIDVRENIRPVTCSKCNGTGCETCGTGTVTPESSAE